MPDKSKPASPSGPPPPSGGGEELQSPAVAYLAIKKAAERQVYPPGVVDGVLMDPKAYFFWLVQRAEGMPADDWAEVLTTSGIPEGFPAGVYPTPNLVYGLTQQIGSGGVRGRIFLPTAVPDALGYYSHPIDCLNGEEPNLTWAWKDAPGGPHPPYVPVNMPGAGGGPGSGGPAVPPEGGTVPPTTTGISEAQVQAMIDAAVKDCLKFGTKIALKTNSGLFAGIKGGGPTQPDAPIEWIGKTGDPVGVPHAWESLEVVKGE